MDEVRADRIEYLKVIQGVISRMARNSFQLKGSAITLVTAALALAGAQDARSIALAGLVPVVGFWALDAYYLRQERLFRKLYDDARTATTTVDFSMNTAPFTSKVASLWGVAVSRTI